MDARSDSINYLESKRGAKQIEEHREGNKEEGRKKKGLNSNQSKEKMSHFSLLTSSEPGRTFVLSRTSVCFVRSVS